MKIAARNATLYYSLVLSIYLVVLHVFVCTLFKQHNSCLHIVYR